VATCSEAGGVDGGMKRILMARSEGGGVEVDGGRKRTATALSEADGVKVDDLRKMTAMTRTEARVEVAAYSKAGDEATTCARARINDGR
jgi:hypothetical protein